MSLEQYKDANRKELWDILHIQVERIAELEAEAVIAMKQHHDLCWKIEELEESVRVDHAIASDYAMALFNRYYKDIADSIPLELCSTSGGVVTQVDNMVAGVMLDMAEEISELEKEQGELNIQIEVLKHSDAEYYGLYSELLFSPNEPPESLEAHNLEQQAKGVRDFFTNNRPRISMGKSAIWEVDDVLVDERIERLTTEAKALKETK
jgi:hypothetical protein